MAPSRSRRRNTNVSPFNRGVFVNCPLDDGYRPLLEVLLFTIVDCGLVPRIASNVMESGRPRIDRIVRLIQTSRFAIHDLSRIRASRAGELSRLNMPFELGLDVGCRLFGRKYRRKVCLILERKKYRYQAALSDLAGSDIAVHDNKAQQIASRVRDWLGAQTGHRLHGAAKIWRRYGDFSAAKYATLRDRGFSKRDIEGLSVNELLHSMTKWVSANPFRN